MLEKISIINRGGIEIFSYGSSSKIKLREFQLMAGFYYTIQTLFEEIDNPINSIKLHNFLIYFKTYSDFSIVGVFSTYVKEEILETFFSDIAKIILFYYEKILTRSYPPDLLDKIGKLVSILENNSNYVRNVRKLYLHRHVKKIAFVGLANAGKTTLKKKFFDKWSKEQIDTIRPTIGIESSKSNIEYLDETMLIMDFGGQEKYRKMYMDQSQNFAGIDCLVYVVDIQKPELFNESKKYLESVMSILQENPALKVESKVIFLHKYDDQNEGAIKNAELFFQIFKDHLVEYRFYITSIKNDSSNDALLQVLFLSLPEIIIKNIFERLLMDKVENRVFTNENVSNYLTLPEKQLEHLGLQIGNEISTDFQEAWLKSYFGEFDPYPRGILSKEIKYIREKNQIQLEIENWESKGIQKNITNPIVTGIIKGILNMLFITNEIEIKTFKHKTIWYIKN